MIVLSVMFLRREGEWHVVFLRMVGKRPISSVLEKVGWVGHSSYSREKGDAQ